MYFLQSGELASEKKLLDERTLRKAELEKVLKELAMIEATKKELDSKIKIISDLKLRQKDAVLMMDKMSRCLPEWVWLTRLDLHGRGGDHQRQGAFQQPDRRPDQQPAEFELVRQCPADIDLRKKEAGIDIFEFRISCIFVRQPDLNKVV